jgi:signal transduction histidine kinase
MRYITLQTRLQQYSRYATLTTRVLLIAFFSICFIGGSQVIQASAWAALGLGLVLAVLIFGFVLLRFLFDRLRAQLHDVERICDDLREAKQRLADDHEAERLLLAQELHDGPIQALYGICFQVNAVAADLHNPAHIEQLSMAQTTAQEIVQSLRSICVELRPPALAPFGLEVAMRSYVQMYMAKHPDLDVQLDLMHDGQLLPERVRLALFRIYQEILNNCGQHAQAHSLLVRLTFDTAHICMTIRDDGRGFEVPKSWIELARQGHLGLLGAHERAESIGGTLEIISSPGRGTLARVTVPSSDTLHLTFG